MNWNLPTIAGIQRIAAILTVVIAVLMFAFVSQRAAISSAMGGGLMIGNLYLLVIVGKAIIGMAGNGGGAAVTIGAIIAPFKLLFFMLIVYLILTRVRVDIFGFLAGVLTQFAAIFIETGRVSMRGTATPVEEVKA